MMTYTTVEECLDDLTADKREQVNALRKIISDNFDFEEHIKWNAPSYVYNGEDVLTFNLHGDNLRLLIHMGATKKEDKLAEPILKKDEGIVTWNSNIRGTIHFADMSDIDAKQDKTTVVISRWIGLV